MAGTVYGERGSGGMFSVGVGRGVGMGGGRGGSRGVGMGAGAGMGVGMGVGVGTTTGGGALPLGAGGSWTVGP